jgi:hypothetical protein
MMARGDDDNMENLCNIIYASFARILEENVKKLCLMASNRDERRRRWRWEGRNRHTNYKLENN